MKNSLAWLVFSACSLAAASSGFAQAAPPDSRPIAAAVRDALQRDPRGSPEAQLLAHQRMLDRQVAQGVQQRLADAGLSELVVSCHDGQVELRGRAAEAALREHATELALGVRDVRSVQNALLLPGETLAEAAPAPAPTDVAVVEPAATEPADASFTEAFGFVTDDGLAGREILVDEADGIVRLRGQVNREAARSYAAAAARSVTGVRVLRDELIVVTATLAESRRLAVLVQKQFDYDLLLQPVAPLMLVTVRDGIVRLEGQVADDVQLQQAEDLAAIQTGVFAVENRLAVNEGIWIQPTRRGPLTVIRTR